MSRLRGLKSGTICCAFKQSESNSNAGAAGAGWETFLTAVSHSAFATTGTGATPARQEVDGEAKGRRERVVKRAWEIMRERDWLPMEDDDQANGM